VPRSPDDDVVLDEHARTIERCAPPRWSDPVFLIGADEFADFLSWKEPDEVLAARARGGDAARFPRETLQAVLEHLEHPERVLFFEIDPTPVPSRDLRARLALGEDVGDEVPSAVGETIRSGGFYAR